MQKRNVLENGCKSQKKMGATIDVKLDEEWTQHKYMQNKIEKLTKKWIKE